MAKTDHARHLGTLCALWAAALAAACLLAFWPPARADAHANIIGSDPPPGASLAQSPAALTLRYSEDLDPSYTSVKLLDSHGGVVVPGPGEIYPAAPRTLSLPLPPLPAGAYSAVWRARSATDGHLTQGTLAFTVGLPAGSVASALALLPPEGAPDPATAGPDAAGTLLSWLSYLAVACLIGGLAFGTLVWHASYQAGGISTAEADAQMTSALKRLACAGLLALAALALLSILDQAAQAAGVPFWLAASARILGRFMTGRTARLLALRGIGAILLVPLVRGLPPAGTGPARRWLLALALSAALLLTFSLQTHSSANDPLGGTFLDWAHLLAMGAWLGGLLPLAVALRMARHGGGIVLTALVPRFSRVALACVAALGLTGLLNALPLVQTVDALTGTTGGRTLMVKAGLFAALIALGAINLLILSPRLRRAGQGAGIGLARTVRIEMALGVLLLLASGVLIGVAPAHDALQADQLLGPSQQAQIGPVRLALRVAPGRIGDDAFGVDVRDGRPGVAASPAQVLLRLSMAGMDMGTTQVETSSQDGNRYVASGSYLTMAGLWQIEVILRRAGFDDVTQDFEVPIGLTAEDQTDSSSY